MVVLADGLGFPEGPCFAFDGTLWWVEIETGMLGSLDKDGTVRRRFVGGRPNGLAFDGDGAFWICDQGRNSLQRYDLLLGQSVTVVNQIAGEALGKPNDLAFDPFGNLVFTCPNDARQEPRGYLCCLDPKGNLRRIAEGLYFPNGLAFMPDGSELIVAETYRHRLWRGRWDGATGTWYDQKPWIEVGGPVGPDGMAFANDGTLFVAIFGRGVIQRVRPDGSALASVTVPGQRPTNVAFDPSGQHGLVVTEAEQGQLLAFPEFTCPPALSLRRLSS